MLKAKELRDQTVEELQALAIDLKGTLFGLVNKREKEKKMDNPQEIKIKRREIARILTVIKQKQLAK
jgi:large subunit ribosomal protein L29